MRKVFLVLVVSVMLLSIFTSLFGCGRGNNENPEYPFDMEKAYYYHRSGVMAGGGCKITLNPEGVATYYSYVKYPPENECGMRDKGADLYFVGLKEGHVRVTIEYKYPTTDSDFVSFDLSVDKDMNVSELP